MIFKDISLKPNELSINLINECQSNFWEKNFRTVPRSSYKAEYVGTPECPLFSPHPCEECGFILTNRSFHEGARKYKKWVKYIPSTRHLCIWKEVSYTNVPSARGLRTLMKTYLEDQNYILHSVFSVILAN